MATRTPPLALSAGVLSFISPCVLPWCPSIRATCQETAWQTNSQAGGRLCCAAPPYLGVVRLRFLSAAHRLSLGERVAPAYARSTILGSTTSAWLLMVYRQSTYEEV